MALIPTMPETNRKRTLNLGFHNLNRVDVITSLKCSLGNNFYNQNTYTRAEPRFLSKWRPKEKFGWHEARMKSFGSGLVLDPRYRRGDREKPKMTDLSKNSCICQT